MKFNYKLVVRSFALVLSAVAVSAAVPGPGESITSLLNSIFINISQFFTMDWAFRDPKLFAGFVRFLLWLTVFIIFYGAGQAVFGRMFANDAGRANRTAAVIAVVIATLTILFMPPEVLFAWGETWSIVIMTLLIGGPVVGLLFLAYSPRLLPAAMDGWLLRGTRIVIIIICWGITSCVTSWGDKIASGVSQGAARASGSSPPIVLVAIAPIAAIYIYKKILDYKIKKSRVE